MPKDFARDLGYLDKFLENLRAHAATLPEPSGSRLAALLTEQDRAWREITDLLSGDPGAADPSARAESPEAASPALPAHGEKPAMGKRLTVGSLIS